MAHVTLERVLAETGVKLDLLEKECAQDKVLSLAEYCDSLTVVGLALGLSEIQISDIDKDHRTAEEKRVALVQKWKQYSAFNATYKTFIQALLTCGRAEQATEICRQLATEDISTNADTCDQPDLNLTRTLPLVLSDEKSDLNLDTTASPISDQHSDMQFAIPNEQSHEASLQDKLDQLEHEYRMITFNFDQSLECVALKKLQSYVASLPLRIRMCYEELKSNDLPSKVKHATCVSEFVAAINDYSNFMNPALLEDAVKMFGDEKTKSEMSAYNGKLQEFQVAAKLEQLVNIGWEGVTPEGYEEIELVLKSDWRKKTLKDISPPKRTWLFKKVFEGSLKVIFSIPDLTDFEEEDVRQFFQKHVEEVRVNGECYLRVEMISGHTALEEVKETFILPDKIAFRFSSFSHGEDVIVSEDGLEARRRSASLEGGDGGCVYIANHLSGRVEFEVQVTDSNSIVRLVSSRSLKIGVAQTQRESYRNLDIPRGYMEYWCYWYRKMIISNLRSVDEVRSSRTYGSVDLHDLECGDRVGVQVTSEGDLSFSFNGFTQGLVARNIYREDRDTYLFVDAQGSTTAVKITRAAMSGYEHPAEGHKGQVNELEGTISPGNIQFKFHPVTGKNIMLLEDGLVARNGSGLYSTCSVVYGSVPIKRYGTFEVEIVESGSQQFGCIKVGVMRLRTGTELTESDVPLRSEEGEDHCVWRYDDLWQDVVSNRLNGNFSMSRYGSVSLKDLQQGDKVGMRLSSDDTLSFFVNKRSQGVAVRGLNEDGYDIYPVVDVCGDRTVVRITRAETCSGEVLDLQKLCVEKIASCLDWSSTDMNLLPLPQKLKNQIKHYIDYL